MQSSRRTFLKSVSAAAVAVGAAGHALPMWAQGAVSSAPVKVWCTYRERRHAAEVALAWKPTTLVNADAILLNTHVARQRMLGFGAAMTDAACYVISQMKATERAELMHEMFAPGEMALNVCRTTIGASDYSRKLYSYDESTEPDPELKKFSIDYDKAYILPVLREARKVNPELFLFSSPWSPPGWMKANNSMLGGAMRKLSFGPYAQYFVKFMEAYKAEGVTIDAVTVQNETDAEQDGRMPACLWAQEEEIEFVKLHLGPALRKAGLPAKIWVIDHNYNLWGRALGELSDPAAYEYIDGIAWHGYVGDPSAITRVHEAFPAKGAHWTEGGPDISQPDYATDYTTWATTFNGIVNNWSESITAWNLALDEKGNPNIGPFPCGGVVTVENGTGKVTRSGQYWAFAHFTKHVQRGAQVFATEGVGRDGAAGPVTHTGFRNPDGKNVVVLANKGPQTVVQLVEGARMLEVELPADSVFTVEWV
jgi:glucosylceramidase